MIKKIKAGRPKKKAADKKKSFSVMITNRFRKKAIPMVREWVKELENKFDKESVA